MRAEGAPDADIEGLAGRAVVPPGRPVPGGDHDVPDGAAALLRWGGTQSPAGLRDGVPLP